MAGQEGDYEHKKIDWEEPAWEDENGGEFEEGEEEQKNSSSSGGCNAGFGAMALLALVSLALRGTKIPHRARDAEQRTKGNE